MNYGTEADDVGRLCQLIVSGHALIRISTHDEAYAMSLVRQSAIELGRDPWVWTCLKGIHHGLLDTDDEVAKDTEHPAAGLYRFLDKPDITLAVMLDLTEHLSDAKTLRLLRDLIQQFYEKGRTLVLVDAEDRLPAVIRSMATEFQPLLPNDNEIHATAKRAIQWVHRDRAVKVDLDWEQWSAVIRNLRGLTRRQIEQIIRDEVVHDRILDGEAINTIMATKRRMIESQGLLEYVQTPTDLDRIGGLNALKGWLKKRERAFNDEAVRFGLTPPRGVMLLGVQGSGKSMCARAIATAWKRPLLRMDPSALYDRYIGESERRLRDALAQAEAMAPIVLWIDEIEKGFASAASRSADGGLSQRMFGTLLTWMQDHRQPVFIVATANDIGALPPELLRKGRFDELFFVDLPDAAARHEIISIHLTRRGRDPGPFELDKLVRVSEGYSGAEIEQGIIAALYDAFSSDGILTTQGVIDALAGSPPLSVTMREKVEALRDWAKSRCVTAN